MADNEKPIINRVSVEAFLVRDKSLKDFNAPFYQWLIENGFRHAWYKGHYSNCDWVFVNITQKLYAYGMPGVCIVKPLGNHAITLDEFYQIYGIYEKYDGLELMVFTEEEQKERHTIRYYVRVSDADTRRVLIETIEKDGYKIAENCKMTREEIIDSEFPIMVNETDKVFGMLQNADEAAEKRLMGIEEFIVCYKGSNCTYDEYYAAVKKSFMEGNYTEEQTETYFQKETDFLKESYQSFIKGIGGSVSSAACCLDWMYE